MNGEQTTPYQELAAAAHTAAMTDLLASSARDIKARQAAAAAGEQERTEELVARERSRAQEQRDLTRRVRAEYRASLNRRERLVDDVQRLRRVGHLWLLLSVAFAMLAIAMAVVAGGSGTLAVLAGAYVCALLLAMKVIRRRGERLTPEFEERVNQQLARVKSTLPVV
jgi:hypothetical protein